MTRSWEEAPLRSWETQQPLYPRTVSIRRRVLPTVDGPTGYGGLPAQSFTNPPSNESVVASGLPASIQLKRARHRSETLPSDAPEKTGWEIYIPGVALGTVTNRDIVVDDLGNRYIVTGAYWESPGVKLAADLLQV